MIGKIAMIAVVVMGLRWLAADAPVSPRTVPMDATAPTAEPAECDCAHERTPQPERRKSVQGERAKHHEGREPVISDADRESVNDMGDRMWTIARPLLVIAADKALEGFASLLRTAADNVPRASRGPDQGAAERSASD